MNMDTYEEILNDVINDKIRITEFMDAIGEKPVSQAGTILTYNAPYNIEELAVNNGIRTAGKPTCLVNTENNRWRDKNYTPWQSLKMLALEMTWNYSEGRLNYIIAHEIFDYRQRTKAQQEKCVEKSDKKATDKQKQKPEVSSKPSKPKRKIRF